MFQLTRRRMLGIATGLMAPAVMAFAPKPPAGTTGQEQADDIEPAKTCPAGYRWSKKRKRCVPDNRSAPTCFVTTACCEAVGLPDDCFELEELRRFRETVLRTSSRGQSLIAEYGIVGPALLDNLPEHARQFILCKFYVFSVLPCVLLSKLGFRRLVVLLYAHGAQRMIKTYAPEIYAARRTEWASLKA